MLDVGVGEQEVVGIKLQRVGDTLLLRPDFSGPASGERLSVQDGGKRCHIYRFGCLTGDFGGRIGAGVVDEYDVEVGIDLLVKKTGDGAGDDISFVASGDHDGDSRARGDGERRLWF